MSRQRFASGLIGSRLQLHYLRQRQAGVLTTGRTRSRLLNLLEGNLCAFTAVTGDADILNDHIRRRFRPSLDQ
ncbi:hypothetical protein MZO42_00960 [Sphingomonas psychrotolerans]|uniref:Uncharacterized protein n=1 Tax=Sphingomonas psychrotolerans TaxID=1327635 RepID=A0ABU3MZ51_9SPHN|nr:hypothetical protein [Sphingomonas psychrotolerans]MDT8757256.1 hypothetical protein [Sphingomonas psychrotolerans]